MEKHNQNENIKESFCGTCVTVPIAMMASGSTMYNKNDKNRKRIFWLSVSITIISIIVSIYFLLNCDECA